MNNPKINSVIRTIALIISGSAMCYWFNSIAVVSERFEHGTVGADRPIVDVLTWFWCAFAAYLVAWIAVGGWSTVRRIPLHRNKIVDLLIVIVFAIAFRIVMTPTVPIQEIDLYRYIWDGAVVSNQLDPYRFGPKTIVDAVNDPSLMDTRVGLSDYTAIVEQRPGLKRALDITHFGEYTTPYPPVSQFVFGMAVSTVKPDAPVTSYVLAMKTALVVFDLATGILVAMLLYHVGMNMTLSLGYLWCPLVIKEIANGGHLDSIATFFAVLAVYLTSRALWRRPESQADQTDEEIEFPLPALSMFSASASALALAAAFAAKVFPVVLVPIWFVALFRRLGVPAIFSLVLFAIAAVAFSFPMLKHLEIAKELEWGQTDTNESGVSDPSGIEAFSKYWEMNDFLFMLGVENLKPAKPQNENSIAGQNNGPWFAVTSNEFRSAVVEQTKQVVDDPDVQSIHQPSHYAFFVTRGISLIIFAGIVAWSCLIILVQPTRTRWLELAFLTVAWFWLLSPTQNPWYWTWSIPLLVFARSRIWILLSGTLLAYYLRFWFEYQFPGIDVMKYWKDTFGESWMQSTFFPLADKYGYQGTRFFDFYVPVLEFGPWFFLLFLFFITAVISRRGTE